MPLGISPVAASGARLRALAVKAVEFASRHLGIDRVLRRRCRDTLVVLCYHGIVPDQCPPNPERLDGNPRMRAFRRHLIMLSKHFSVVSATDVWKHVVDGAPLPPYPALITFDDGLRNNLTCAAPELQRMGMPALVFVPTAHLGKADLLWTHELMERIVSWRPQFLPMPQGQPDVDLQAARIPRWQVAARIRGLCKALPEVERRAYLERLREQPLQVDPVWRRDLYAFLSWDEVRTLVSLGWSVGSHTVSHPILPNVSREELAFELKESKQRIEEELGTACRWFAYPNGSTCAEVTSAVGEAGYEMAFLLNQRLNSRSLRRLEVNRINIGGYGPQTFLSQLGGFRALPRARASVT